MIDSIKDLHWDIRPSPAFGTVEVRVMDTPLTLDHAINMAGLIQATAHWLLTERPFKPQEQDYLLYKFNRFSGLPLWSGGRANRCLYRRPPSPGR
ncbi:carboxylate-amine ligase [Salmonella sp. NCTC 11881]|nr:carboxylate-amine ligase [Salmonella sp. NCTC 11881]